MLSRVAENFYWLARYLERMEHTARLLEVSLELMPDQMSASEENWARLLEITQQPTEGMNGDPAYFTTRTLAFDAENPDSVVSTVAAVRTNARQVRQHISAEMFEHLNALYWRVRRARMEDVWAMQPIEFFRGLQQASHTFWGLIESTMDHAQEYLFMQLGKSIERASATARLLDVHYRIEDRTTGGGFEARDYLRWVGLLKGCTAFEAYLRSHHAEIDPRTVAQFLVLDATFPRSMRYCSDRIVGSLERLALATGGRRSDTLDRTAGRLQASLQFSSIEEILGGGMQRYLAEVERRCGGLNASIYETYISYPVEILE